MSLTLSGGENHANPLKRQAQAVLPVACILHPLGEHVMVEILEGAAARGTFVSVVCILPTRRLSPCSIAERPRPNAGKP